MVKMRCGDQLSGGKIPCLRKCNRLVSKKTNMTDGYFSSLLKLFRYIEGNERFLGQEKKKSMNLCHDRGILLEGKKLSSSLCLNNVLL